MSDAATQDIALFGIPDWLASFELPADEASPPWRDTRIEAAIAALLPTLRAR